MVHLSLTRVIVGLCVTLIVVTAAISLFVTYSFSLSAANEIATQHVHSIATKARTSVENFFAGPLGYISGLQYTVPQGFYPLPNHTEASGNLDWFLWWWQQMSSAMKAVNFKYQYAVIGFDDGNYAGCKLVGNGQYMCRVFSWRTRESEGLSYVYQETYNISEGEIVSFKETRTTYDPRTRGWYHMVEHKPLSMEWSPVYLSAMPTLPIVDVNAALFNGTGTMLGIISLTFELGMLSDFLRDLVTTKNTRAVLLDNDDLLMASSYGIPYLSETNISADYSDPVPSNCLKSDVANDATRSILLCRHSVATYPWSALQDLKAKTPTLLQDGSSSPQLMELAGEKYWAAVVPISTPLSKGMGWRFVLLMPENDIIGGIIQGRNIALGIVSAVLLFTCLASGITVSKMLEPLSHLADRMYRTACLQDNDTPEDKSSLSELATIQTAYETMNSELSKVKSYLPQSVMAALYGTTADEDEEDEGHIEIAASEPEEKCKAQGSQPTNAAAGAKGASSFHRHASYRQRSMASMVSAKMSAKNSMTHIGGTAVAALNMALKLVTRKATILVMNLSGFNMVARNQTPDELLSVHGTIVSIVSQVVKDNKGVLDGFHGDHFTASFNAVTYLGNHAFSAAAAALTLIEKLQNPMKFHTTGITCGIATGQALVGNMGSAEMKRFCVIGPVYAHACIFEKLCKKYPSVSCISGGLALTELEQFVEMQYLDVITLPYSNPPNDTKRQSIAALRAMQQVSCDEWMYQLQEGAGRSKYKLHNDAFQQFVAGNAAEAAELWRRYLEEPQAHADPIAQAWASLSQRVKNTEMYANPLLDFYSSCITKQPQCVNSVIIDAEKTFTGTG